MNAIAKTFTPLWRSRNGFQVRNLGNHMVLFVFYNKEEVEKVIQSEPWSFDKHLMVLERYDKNNLVKEFQFNKTTFWVQVHGLPIKFMNVRAAAKICEVLGTVLPSTNQQETEGGNFVRIRVSLDVTIPLCRGRLVSIGRDKEVWVSFKYERLLNSCYWCSCFDHDNKDCEKWLNSEGTLTPDQRLFGPTLRAAPFFPSRKQVVSVPSFYKSRQSSTPKSAPPYSAELKEQKMGRSTILEQMRSSTDGEERMESMPPEEVISSIQGNNQYSITDHSQPSASCTSLPAT